MNAPFGWYVRVRTGELKDGVCDTVLYVVGYPIPAEAEAAVKRARSKPAEEYWVVDVVIAGREPQPEAGEVRLLIGAV